MQFNHAFHFNHSFSELRNSDGDLLLFLGSLGFVINQPPPQDYDPVEAWLSFAVELRQNRLKTNKSDRSGSLSVILG